MGELLAVAHVAVIGVMIRRAVLEAAPRAWEPARDRLYCRREGQGTAILFLHGLAGSWRYWRRGLPELARDHALYVPDLLGFGRSPKPRGDYSAAMHAEAVGGLLQEIGTVEVVVGHSMGAIILPRLPLTGRRGASVVRKPGCYRPPRQERVPKALRSGAPRFLLRPGSRDVAWRQGRR
ncbi:MAG TPA: hypothetical protein DCQ64_06195 [Candidatus Rokubacteria bacterium]|nr:MAG: hypothetical protein A2X53_06845 [Candidatus Rokubacteria bacterium GWA2_70_23]OGK91055.1 MAG: hypothetical protein A2X50_04765 [Candidatus Rokubacteria bacterium GWF2_70_14]OGL13579.1 MAG: hypothetical protein A3K12_07885 [Candidatus Rokubacteria bacterium RIFCSPLOWO2_12_FULL_71_19]HAM55000.1 hypothetical protein [Candidatus Rokubacteria bacterium]